ncbi:MAG TPA: helix-turn-helix transcriptional regulator [Candidatus Paceibacterota bacterium]
MVAINANTPQAKRCGKKVTGLIFDSLLECPKDDLAIKLGKEVSYVQQIERGEVSFGEDVLALMANFFQKSPDYLIN